MVEGNPGCSLRTDVCQRRPNFDPLTTVEQNDHVGAAAYLMKRAVAAVAVGALPDGTPVIVSGSRDGTVRVWRPGRRHAGRASAGPTRIGIGCRRSRQRRHHRGRDRYRGPPASASRDPRASWRSISGNNDRPAKSIG